jgi:endonuclease III
MAALAVAPLRRSARNVKKEAVVKIEASTSDEWITPQALKRSASPASPKGRKIKKLKAEMVSPPRPISSPAKADVLKERKLKSFSAFSKQSPYPAFARPTAAECRTAHSILAQLHGERLRPGQVVAPTKTAGCGDSPSVLDALVRTILSQNTSNKNSTRAKLSMDDEYGGSDRWEEIAQGGQARLQKAIQTGGLAATKSKVIIGILQQTRAKYGVYSLDHLFEASDEDAMREMIAFQGVGPKTASCVLLFCLQRPSFAVDTHVHRIAGLLGWRPAAAGREETQAHLDAVVPDEEKYPLHVLFVTHGRLCGECRAGGRSAKSCELRRAFRNGRFDASFGVEGEDSGAVKKEEDLE